MNSISEFLYHATGLCGHVHHPSLINVTVIALVSFLGYLVIRKKIKSNG
jgi:uncharacterized membrane protein (DUF4010 family)